uniref:Uncharacterized protein n=1 Tax=viral metagenome TaxID=1070528 RepID=A0A6H1ZW93_9ZZZZ
MDDRRRVLGPDGRIPHDPKEGIDIEAEALARGMMPPSVFEKLQKHVGQSFHAFGVRFILGAISPVGIAAGFVEVTGKQRKKEKPEGFFRKQVNERKRS